jgi:hypothetical protein
MNIKDLFKKPKLHFKEIIFGFILGLILMAVVASYLFSIILILQLAILFFIAMMFLTQDKKPGAVTRKLEPCSFCGGLTKHYKTCKRPKK